MNLAAYLPGRRTEDWRWADLSGLEALAASPANDLLPDPSRWWLDLDGPRLLFVDGRFVAGMSDARGIDVTPERGAPGHPLGDIAAARATGGMTLRIGVEGGTAPIQLVHVATGGAAQLSSRIELADGAHAELHETHVGRGWSNAASVVDLAVGARLMRTLRVIKDGGAHTDFTRVDVAEAASYTATALVAGCDAARIEAQVRLNGVGAYAQADGVVLGRAAQTLDAFNRFDHLLPGGTSKQVWRMVADDRATTSFAGRVAVARGAQKTDAVQSVKALLLSRTATANAKPELEIFADDVKCAHGASVGELNPEAMFYLASRGIAPEDARALLIESFVADALAGIGDPVAQAALAADAVAWLRTRP